MAYMSDVGGQGWPGQPDTRTTLETAGCLPLWARQRRAADAALREAERILAETEPRPHEGFYPQHVSLDALNDGFKALRGVIGKRYTIRTEEAQVLADSLAAILPVLDELAEDAYVRNEYQLPIEQQALHLDAYLRNRAVNAALDAR